MAPDINLLPDEQRRTERRELESPRGSASPEMSEPRRVAAFTPPQPAAAAPPLPAARLPEAQPKPAPLPSPETPKPHRPSLLAGLASRFSRKPKPAADVPPTPGGSLEVNLIPQETAAPSWTQLWPLIAAVGGAAAAVGVAYLAIGLSVSAQQSEVSKLLSQRDAIAAQLVAQGDQVAEISRAVKQVKVARGLLDSHVYWTQFFDWMETATLPDVYFSGFMGDIGGKFTLTASARDYVTLAQQLVSLQADRNVQQVSVSEASRDSDGWVNFSLSLTVSPSILAKVQQQ